MQAVSHPVVIGERYQIRFAGGYHGAFLHLMFVVSVAMDVVLSDKPQQGSIIRHRLPNARLVPVDGGYFHLIYSPLTESQKNLIIELIKEHEINGLSPMIDLLPRSQS